MTILTYAIAVIFMAFVNRLRGSSGALMTLGNIASFDVTLSFAGTLMGGAVFGIPAVMAASKAGFSAPWQAFFMVLVIGAFFFGESWGWDKWVKWLIWKRPKDIAFWVRQVPELGIDQLANWIAPETKGYTNHCRVALSLRGLVWWVPVLAVPAALGGVSWFYFVVYVMTLALWFPLACEAVRLVGDDDGPPGIRNRWEQMEVMYGGIQGAVLWHLFWNIFNAP